LIIRLLFTTFSQYKLGLYDHTSPCTQINSLKGILFEDTVIAGIVFNSDIVRNEPSGFLFLSDVIIVRNRKLTGLLWLQILPF